MTDSDDVIAETAIEIANRIEEQWDQISRIPTAARLAIFQIAAVKPVRAAVEAERAGTNRLRALLARAYRAAMKPEWEEGECLEEVLLDMKWEGIDSPEAIAAIRQSPTDDGEPK